MKRIYDKQPWEHRKRSHYNRKGTAKQAFPCEEDAQRYIARRRLRGYSAYLCPGCNHWHIGKR
nr:MAG TPA: transposase-like protein [Caudoviricetes sp.]